MNESVEFIKLRANGILLNVAVAGPKDGHPVVLLHGFPDAWFGWSNQIEKLVDAGFRVIVPDQRGYNLSDKPRDVKDYQIDILVEDVVSITSELGYVSFSLAGHDWGAGVAWMLALKHPNRLNRLAILNVPHPKVFREFVRSNFSQMLKSWYILFFQIPKVPEFLSKLNNYKVVLNQMPQLSVEDKQRYIEAWSKPGAFTAMLNWYRAAMAFEPVLTGESIVSVPTLIIWGRRDRYLHHKMAERSIQYCSNSELVVLEDATHWVMFDEPDKVSSLLIDHFSKK